MEIQTMSEMTPYFTVINCLLPTERYTNSSIQHLNHFNDSSSDYVIQYTHARCRVKCKVLIFHATCMGTVSA